MRLPAARGARRRQKNEELLLPGVLVADGKMRPSLHDLLRAD